MKVFIVNYRGTNYAAFSSMRQAACYAEVMFGEDEANILTLTVDAVNLESLKALV